MGNIMDVSQAEDLSVTVTDSLKPSKLCLSADNKARGERLELKLAISRKESELSGPL